MKYQRQFGVHFLFLYRNAFECDEGHYENKCTQPDSFSQKLYYMMYIVH